MELMSILLRERDTKVLLKGESRDVIHDLKTA